MAKGKYYFVAYITDGAHAGVSTFSKAQFRHGVTKRHPFTFIDDNGFSLLSFQEITEQDYKLGKKLYWDDKSRGYV